MALTIFAMMMPARVVRVMGAAFGRVEQLAVEIGMGQFCDGGPGLSGADGDASFRKEVQRTPADAAGNHDIRALLVKPAREQPGRVRRGGHGPDAENSALRGIGLHERKPGAAAKMFTEAAFGCWNGDGHGRRIY